MLIEYDLVIIGATELGCYMALRARELGARVALVEQGERPDGAIAFRFAQNWGLGGGSSELTIELSDQLSQFTPETLLLRGIDYIPSSGSWIKTPKSGFQVNERLLRSANFVSALTPKRRIPAALSQIACVFPEAFPLADPLPKRVAIVGEAIVGVALALRLKALGVMVTLIVPTPQILPQVPLEGAFRLQMELEAAGVRVLTGTRLRSSEQLQGAIQLQLAHEILEVDQVILATAFARLEPERLGLRSLNGAALQQHRLRLVGSAAQSGLFDGLISNPESVALAEVQSVLMPWRGRRSQVVGQLTNPPSVWVGAAGKPEDYSLTGSLNDRSLWYHLTVTHSGELVNGTVVGSEAAQFGALLSLMLQTKMSIKNLKTIALSSPIQIQVIHQWLVEWERLRRSRHPLRHELFLDWLAFWRRRSF